MSVLVRPKTLEVVWQEQNKTERLDYAVASGSLAQYVRSTEYVCTIYAARQAGATKSRNHYVYDVSYLPYIGRQGVHGDKRCQVPY